MQMRRIPLVIAAWLVIAGVAVAGSKNRPLQTGSSQGVRLAVYTPGRAVFDLSHATRSARQHLRGGRLAPGCVKARIVNGLWQGEDVFGPNRRFARRMTLVLVSGQGPALPTQLRAPYDGCEIGGFYGHRWNDAWGTRDAVEIWLTARGRHFFNDRAAARDLAYFVRSGRVQKQIRLSETPEAGLAWYVRRYPGRVVRIRSRTTRVAKDVVGVWIGPRTIVFTATSSTGRRLFVVAKRGSYRLPNKNLGDLALVF